MKATAAVLAVIGGGAGFALGVVVCTVAALGNLVFHLHGTWWTVALLASGSSVALGVLALVAAGRGTVDPQAAIRPLLAVGLLALPLGWGAFLLAASFCNRRATQPDRAGLGVNGAVKIVAFALGAGGCCVLAGIDAIFLLASDWIGLVLVAFTAAAASGVVLIAWRPRLGATLTFCVGVLCLIADTPFTYPGMLLAGSGAVAFLVAIRRYALRLAWGGLVGLIVVGSVVDALTPGALTGYLLLADPLGIAVGIGTAHVLARRDQRAEPPEAAYIPIA